MVGPPTVRDPFYPAALVIERKASRRMAQFIEEYAKYCAHLYHSQKYRPAANDDGLGLADSEQLSRRSTTVDSSEGPRQSQQEGVSK